LCGGVLIGPRLVLSAAHCEDASSQIRVGAFEDPSDGDRVNILSTIVHPDYEHSRFDNDIIIFQLERDVDLPYIKLGPEHISGGTFTVIGFGDTDKGSELVLSNILQEVELTYIDTDDCDDGHGNRNEVKEDMMCLAGEDKDSCIGDSGGPMIRKGLDSYSDTLVGIVSWGRGCAEKGVPGVYSRISHFYDWILEAVCENYSKDAPYYMRCESRTVARTYYPTQTTLAPTSMDSLISSTINDTELSTNYSDDLEFIAWTPKIKLKNCQGDCDTDNDCEWDFVCFKRNGEIDTRDVPGCTSSGAEPIADNIDVCINPNVRI